MYNFLLPLIKNRRLFLFAMVMCGLQLTTSAQNPATMLDEGDGEYSFSSNEDASDLHFYLFNDGYHSFAPNIEHEYKSADIVPEIYHANGYDDDDIIGIPLGETSSITPTPSYDIMEMEGAVQIKKSWNPVEDKDNFFILMFQNTSDDPNDIWNGSVEFHFHIARSTIASADIQDGYNGWVNNKEYHNSSAEKGTNRRYTWDFSGLEPGDQRFIYIPTTCTEPAYTRIITHGVLNHGGVTEKHRLNSTVSAYPYDPNMITSECSILDEDATTQSIPYRLHFHNVGKDPAKDVTVNFLTEGAYTNVTLVGSSHDCVLEWLPFNPSSSVNYLNQCAEIFFEDIFLPGDNQNPPSGEPTHGWVDILVCYDLTKQINDCLDTQIDIIFNDLDPVVARHQICYPTGDPDLNQICDDECKDISPFVQVSDEIGIRENSIASQNKATFNVYPNPTSEFLFVEGIEFIENTTISIQDIHSRIQNIKNVDSSRFNISNLTPGIYNIIIQDGSTTKVKQFVKL